MSSLTINSNIAALNAQRRLGQSTASLQDSFTRLSSGLRINKARDDASGLAISKALEVDARVFTQAVRNVNDGISMLAVAEGALTELSSITQRQLELAEQAANGVLGLEQRKALDAEANALVDEYNRIVESVSFNNRNLLDVSGESIATRLQAGYGEQGGLSLELGGFLAQGVGDGTFEAAVSIATSREARRVEVNDFNNDGFLDVINLGLSGESDTFLGNGDGTFKSPVSYDFNLDTRRSEVADLNQDGKLDLVISETLGTRVGVLYGNGDGTFQPMLTLSTGDDAFGIQIEDLNRDGILDIMSASNSESTYNVHLGLGDGTFATRVSYTANAGLYNLELFDANSDGILDVATSNNGLGNPVLSLGNGDGTFRAATSLNAIPNNRTLDSADLNHDGYSDLVFNGNQNAIHVLLSNGDGTFKARETYSTSGGSNDIEIVDFNGDGLFDVVAANANDDTIDVLLGKGDGTFATATSIAVGDVDDVDVGDLNGDGAIDIITPSFSDSAFFINFANSIEVSRIGQLDLLTQENAKAILPVLREQLERVAAEKGNIGSFQSRLQTAASNLAVNTENLRAAESRIVDVDVAKESAKLVRSQILQQAGVAVLAQANQSPQLALLLLG